MPLQQSDPELQGAAAPSIDTRFCTHVRLVCRSKPRLLCGAMSCSSPSAHLRRPQEALQRCSVAAAQACMVVAFIYKLPWRAPELDSSCRHVRVELEYVCARARARVCECACVCVWCVVCGAWCVVRGVWCVVCGVWCVCVCMCVVVRWTC